jgi:hypothetical protein
MDTRFNYVKVAAGTYEAMRGLERYLHSSGLKEALLHLIKLRVEPGTYQPAAATPASPTAAIGR